jgi:hypothetical protein
MNNNARVMVLLLGEQPAPNLIPLRILRPQSAVLVYTDRTEYVFQQLAAIIKDVKLVPCEVPPFDFEAIREATAEKLRDYTPSDVLFNLTGGTKIMALAAYDLAQAMESRFVYLISQGAFMQLETYHFADGRPVRQESRRLDETITLEDYLRMYIGNYTFRGPRDAYEKQIDQALAELSDLERLSSVCLKGGLEVDFMLRYGNNVAAVEVKRTAKKDAIDQINSAARQTQLGTFVRKIIVTGESLHPHNAELAQGARIKVIELPSLSDGVLSEADQEALRTGIRKIMGMDVLPTP